MIQKLDDLAIFVFTTVHSFFISEVLGNSVLATVLAYLSYQKMVSDANTIFFLGQSIIVILTVFLSIKFFPTAKYIYTSKAVKPFALGIAGLYGLAFAVTTLANELQTVVLTLLKT